MSILATLIDIYPFVYIWVWPYRLVDSTLTIGNQDTEDCLYSRRSLYAPYFNIHSAITKRILYPIPSVCTR